MNPRIPYRPDRRSGPGCLGTLFWTAVPLTLLGFVVVWVSGAAGATRPSPVASSGAPPVVTITPPAETPMPTETQFGGLAATLTAVPALPTSTRPPPPSPSPTAIQRVVPTQFYTTQSGDALPALAARFGVNPADILAPTGLQGSTFLAPGQLLVIPQVLGEVGPGTLLIPDSELVFSGAASGFDPQAYAEEHGGYLARYIGYADDRAAGGGDVILAAATDHSINPRLLVALLEYQSGWVTNPQPTGNALNYPYGRIHPYLRNLNSQLTWAASQLGIGYYGWRDGSLTVLTFPDGSTLRLDPTLNAGTAALQFFFAQTLNRPAWDEAVGEQGFIATYRALFGEPFERALDPLLPPDLAQIPLALPFQAGSTWNLTGGPHGAWERGGAQAALDFAPSAVAGGCAESGEWVTAVAAGLVLRSSRGVVMVDLDGDGYETTGWNILYLHVSTQGRVAAGTFVEQGDRIAHPSCEGGRSTGTHVHVARKYNGEWILADSVVPFNLSGWVAARGQGEYLGTLTRNGITVEACTCTAAFTAIRADE